MTDTTIDTSSPSSAEQDTQPLGPPAAKQKTQGAAHAKNVLPVLEKLFTLYPHLFGAEFLPLKLGVFQELLAAHPEQFERSELKAALGVHARSTRYLQCVAAGKQRHDLQGNAVEPVAVEHVFHAIVELFRRKQNRQPGDLRPKLRAQLRAAFEASGMTRQDYLARVSAGDTDATGILEEALDEHDQALAKQVALRKAFEASGKTAEEFADMYGMDVRQVNRALA